MLVELEGGADAIVHCGAFYVITSEAAAEVAPKSVFEVMQQQVSVSSSSGVAELSIRSLGAASTYNVFCATESFKGVLMSTSQMLSMYATADTACCKTVGVTQMVTSLYTGDGALGAIQVTLDALPASELVVGVSMAALGEGGGGNSIHPSSISFTSTSVSRTAGFSLEAGALGSYQLRLELGGDSAAQFISVFSVGSGMVSVLAVNQEPGTPQLSGASFSADGSLVYVTFDAPTDKGAVTNGFACSSKLEFAGSAASTCQWKDASTIRIYPSVGGSSDLLLGVGSAINVTAGSGIRAQCTVSAALCSTWSTVAAASVTVVAPADPSRPTVVLSLPSSASACSGISVDLSASVGSGGRAWADIAFSVTSSDSTVDVSGISELLNGASFAVSSPTVIPAAMLQPGLTYSFTATMCNFLGACAQTSRSVLVASSEDMIPIVQILGQQQRSIVTGTALLLTADAYTVDCNGTRVTTGLEYQWTVYESSVKQPGLVSASQNPAKFRLSAFSLQPLHTYEVRLDVHSAQTLQSSSITTTLFVVQSELVAQLSGGSSRSVAIGTTLTLDASGSFDKDQKGVTDQAAGLFFEWTCVQTRPRFSIDCALDVEGSSTAETISLVANLRSINTTSTVTVTIYDATRSSSTSVEISTQDSSAPLVSILTSARDVTALNVKKQLQLKGTVTVQSPCTAAWSVDDKSLALSNIALSPVATVVPIGSTRTINLALAPSTLPLRSSLQFSLSCGSSSASLVVTTNGPPLPGTFAISPKEGVEVSTSFLFTASSWMDEHLPITYQFGFVSGTSGVRLVLRGRSEGSFAASTLPAGAETEGFAVSCYGVVFDALDAQTEQTGTVLVTVAEDAQAVQEQLVAQLSAQQGDVEATMNTLSVGSSVLNAVNCSLTPATFCATLHRAACAEREHSCGACLNGFVGEMGAANTLCASAESTDARRLLSQASSATASVACSGDEDCSGAWEVCDAVSSTCTVPLKDCSGGAGCGVHGTCGAFNRDSLVAVDACLLNDPSCIARCVCTGNYTGSRCDVSYEESARRMALRRGMLQSLAGVTALDDINVDSVAAWTRSLSALAQNPYGVSAADVVLVQEVALAALQNAGNLSPAPSYQDLADLLDVVDTLCAALALAPAVDIDSAELANSNAQLLILFNALTVEQLVAGQNAVQFVQQGFRSSSSVQFASGGGARGSGSGSGKSEGASSLQVGVPQSEMESALGSRASSVTIDTAPGSMVEGQVAVVVVSTAAAGYGVEATSYSSNPMQLQLSSTAAGLLAGGEVRVVLTHNAPVSFPNSSVSFNTTCTGSSDTFVHNYTCPGSGQVVSHRCTGKKGTFKSYCPVLAPSCGASTACRVVSFNAHTTTCACNLTATSASTSTATYGGRLLGRVRARRLQSGEEVMETFALDMVSTAAYFASQFTDSFEAADSFNSVEDLQRVLIVILMFAVLWGVGLAVIFGCVWRRKLVAAQEREG